ncbi:MAG: porin [Sandaracinaceae bacterium]|nr:porin [Sandaracinaceae bacterium]
MVRTLAVACLLLLGLPSPRAHGQEEGGEVEMERAQGVEDASDPSEPALAEVEPSELDALREELARLSRRLEVFEREREAAAGGPPPPPAAHEPRVAGAPGGGLTVAIGDAFSLNLRTRFQIRYQLDVPQDRDQALSQMVNIGTARLWISGHVLAPELTYMIQLAVAGRDFRDGLISPIFDAFLEWRGHRDLSVRAGQFFVPFDRLRTVREWALQMGDRPRPVLELTLDRDVGVVLFSDAFLDDRSPFAWRLGVFGGGGTNLTEGRPPGALLVGRLELRPLGRIDDDTEGDLDRRHEPGLALGAAFAVNFGTDRALSTTGPRFAGQATTDYLHFAADLVFKWEGFALQAEYLWKQASADQLAADVFTRSGHGWVLQASYVFDPPIELVGRLSQLYAIGATDPRLVEEAARRGVEVAAGLNYYLNGHRFKIQADWIARMPSDFDLSQAQHVVHVQLDATF